MEIEIPELKALIKEIHCLKEMLEKKSQWDGGSQILTNNQFIKLMNISARTAQNWRDEGTIAFSQVGGKIYYHMKDVQELLQNNYHESIKQKTYARK